MTKSTRWARALVMISIWVTVCSCIAGCSIRHRTEVNEIDSGQYVPTALPQESVPPWNADLALTGRSSLQIKHGEPELDSTAAFSVDTANNDGDMAFFSRTIKVMSGDQIEVEAKVKLSEYSGHTTWGGCALWIEDNVKGEAVIINPEGIFLFNAQLGYAMNTTNHYHIYRIVARGDQLKIYVDGGKTPAIEAAFRPWSNGVQARHWIAFGDGSGGAGSNSLWAYVKYNVRRI